MYVHMNGMLFAYRKQRLLGMLPNILCTPPYTDRKSEHFVANYVTVQFQFEIQSANDFWLALFVWGKDHWNYIALFYITFMQHSRDVHIFQSC